MGYTVDPDTLRDRKLIDKVINDFNLTNLVSNDDVIYAHKEKAADLLQQVTKHIQLHGRDENTMSIMFKPNQYVLEILAKKGIKYFPASADNWGGRADSFKDSVREANAGFLTWNV